MNPSLNICEQLADLKSKKYESVIGLPANGVFVTYSDHYRGNSGDDLVFTDTNGRFHDLGGNFLQLEDSQWADDRKVISVTEIILEGASQMQTFIAFKQLCRSYTEASKELKLYTPINSVLESTRWYKFTHKRCSAKTIEKKRDELLKSQTTVNNARLQALKDAKQIALNSLNSIGISARVAYLLN